MSKNLIYAFFVMTILAQNSALAETCKGADTETIMKNACSIVNDILFDDIGKDHARLDEALTYDDCGLNALVIYDSAPPLKMLKHTHRPAMIDYGIYLGNIIHYKDKYTFADLTKKSGANGKFVEFTKVLVPLNLLKSTKNFSGMNCKTKDNALVTIASSTVLTPNDQKMGGWIIRSDISILDDPDVLLLAQNTVYVEKSKALFRKIAYKIMNGTISYTSLALGVPKKRVTFQLFDRIKSPIFTDRITTMDPKHLNKYSIVGAIIDDLEYSLSTSTTLMTFHHFQFIDTVNRVQTLESQLTKNKILGFSAQHVAVALSALALLFSLISLIKTKF